MPVTDLQNRLQEALGDAYHIERELARGGMSRLFLATEASLNRQVVIKLLPPEMASAVSAARFQQEIAVAAQLQHPHVLPVHAAGAQDDLIYYVMPYVSGESLRHRLEEGKLPVEDAVRILREVADALAYAHGRGVVHRDIKPENILLQQGHAVLTDFGVARAVEEARGEAGGGARLTEMGMAVGTPGYMSPEQAAGERNVDARADVYALAVVGYEMLTGGPPFGGATPQAVLAAHLTQVPQSVHELESQTPEPVSAAIARGLAKDPNERFQTAAEFRHALQSATAMPAGSKRMSLGKIITTMVVLVVLGSLAWALRPNGFQVEGDPRKSLIVYPFENKTGDQGNDYLEDAAMNLLGLAVGHWEDMRVFDDERTSSLLRRREIDSPKDIDFDAAQAMARDAKVGTLVLGDIRREGDSLALEAKIHDVRTGDRLATEIVRAGFGTDPRPLFDSLAARLLRVSGAPASERPDLVSQTTTSLEAYREYLAGARAIQVMQIDSAKTHLERAVELDSTFALAYIRLRDADGWAGIEGSPATRRALIAKAQAYGADLPPRFRQLIAYYQAYENGQYQRAREIAGQMIAHDSSDVEAWYQLGEAHFHHDPGRVPHSDTLGDYGKALYAFQHTLELDSAYTVAYRHIIDVLGNCGADAPWLCFLDSTVYGRQDQLTEQFGQETVARMRQQARDDRLTTAYAWVEAVPSSNSARATLIDRLVADERLGEAESQIGVLRAGGESVVADAWESRLTFLRADYGTAGLKMRDLLDRDPEAFRQVLGMGDPGQVISALAGAGMVTRMGQFIDQLLALVPTDTVSGPGGVGYPKPLMKQFFSLGLQGSDLGRASHDWLDTLAAHYEPGSPAHMLRLANSGSTLLHVYLEARDTSVLSRFVAEIDTTGSRTWRAMLAHLLLERGDTAAARTRLDQHFTNRDEVEISGEPGCARLSAWANLLTRLGEAQAGARAFALFDTDAAVDDCPSHHVESWAERGALYQQLGDRAQAIENYERFLTAWQHADDRLQARVDRARSAVAALKGETAPAPEGQ
jgi:serine/threonine-protein kinase